ncbi:hypothetical protein, partial [Streptomyces sp. NPDC059863]
GTTSLRDVQVERSLRSRWPSRCEGRSLPLRFRDRWGRPLRARLAAQRAAVAGGVSGATKWGLL